MSNSFLPEPGRCAGCDGEWFQLVDSDMNRAAVAIAETGAVTGYSGRLVCLDCGATWQHPAERAHHPTATVAPRPRHLHVVEAPDG